VNFLQKQKMDDQLNVSPSQESEIRNTQLFPLSLIRLTHISW